MIRYQIRSIALLNIVNDIKSKRLIPDPYFQRNLVWRDVHKRDFIETILKGLPFPQMFFSRGKIDVEQMMSVSCVVDGQQRSNAIVDYVDNKFSVGGRFFKDLTQDEKAAFFKYEVGIVELDVDNDDPVIKDIFARVNRTSNSLTTIEKLASAFAPTEYMFVARLLAADLVFPGAEQGVEGNPDDEDWKVDPNTPTYLFDWARGKQVNSLAEETSRLGIFSEREIARRVHVMHVLNIVSTLLAGFFNRNERTLEFLEDYKDGFDEKDNVVEWVNAAGEFIRTLSLTPNSFWTTKASFFSLVVAIANELKTGRNLSPKDTRDALLGFAANPSDAYVLAAREGVNNKRERTQRNTIILSLLK